MPSEVQLGASILLLLGAVAYFTNLTINLVRRYTRLPLWLVIAMLLVGGPLYAFLFWLTGAPERTPAMITWSVGASIVLGGIAGSAGALAANEAQSQAQPTKPPAP